MTVASTGSDAGASVQPGVVARRAVVVGAFGGIGQATVARLTQDGWVVLSLDQAAVLPAQAQRQDVVAVDIADPVSVAAAFEQVRTWSTPDGIDLLVICSGVVDTEKVATVSLDHWHAMLAVNLTGPLLCCQHSYPLLRDGGRIVLLGSLAGRTGGVLTGAAYAASKGGIESLGKSMAQELAVRGITVNVVAPGAIETPMLNAHSAERKENMARSTPLKRLGRPDEIAAVIAFLARPDAGFMTGAVVHVNGGIRMD